MVNKLGQSSSISTIGKCTDVIKNLTRTLIFDWSMYWLLGRKYLGLIKAQTMGKFFSNLFMCSSKWLNWIISKGHTFRFFFQIQNVRLTYHNHLKINDFNIFGFLNSVALAYLLYSFLFTKLSLRFYYYI